MTRLIEFIDQSYIMGPHSLVHIVDQHLTDVVLEGFGLIANSRVCMATHIDDFVERTFGDLLGRKAPVLGRHDHYVSDIVETVKHITSPDTLLVGYDTYPDGSYLHQAVSAWQALRYTVADNR